VVPLPCRHKPFQGHFLLPGVRPRYLYACSTESMLTHLPIALRPCLGDLSDWPFQLKPKSCCCSSVSLGRERLQPTLCPSFQVYATRQHSPGVLLVCPTLKIAQKGFEVRKKQQKKKKGRKEERKKEKRKETEQSSFQCQYRMAQGHQRRGPGLPLAIWDLSQPAAGWLSPCPLPATAHCQTQPSSGSWVNFAVFFYCSFCSKAGEW